MNRLIVLAAFVLTALPTIASAQEAALPSSTYSPEFCEFSIAFPEAPYKTRKCDDAEKTRCYDQISYTQVYELDTTVNFRAICNKIDDDVISNYSGEIMEATLRAMTKDTVVKTFDTSFREEENYKQAGLVGEGKVGRTPTIYIAQLWIGKNSAFSVEAELIGQAHDKADELFSTILRSVGYKGEIAVTEEPAKNAPKEKPED